MNARQKTLAAPLAEVELKTKAYADARGMLASAVSELREEQERLARKYMERIKGHVARSKAAQAELRAEIEAHPELFVKPRTHILHGIKVGYRKATGKIDFDDADQVVKLIRKHFPEQFDVLVKTEETPIKKALGSLSAAELKKLGIEVNETGDVVEIKDTTSDVDKFVAALLKDETEGL